MGRLFGKVLVKETNVGIPDLVVAAFDQDPAARGDAAAVNHRREQQGVDGARLGAVLTGPGGTFEMEYETWTKGRPGSEIRPDLVIAVFAPEDSAGLRDPNPQPPDQRILHVSSVPRIDASPIEGYVIRLLRAQLEELGIPFLPESARRDPHVDADALTGSVERTWALRDAVRERLTPRLEKEAKRDAARKMKAKEWAKRLSLTPPHLAAHPLFARDRDSVVKLHEAAVKAGLARLKNYKPSLRLNLRDEELGPLGLEKDGDEIQGRVTLDELNARAFAASGGPDLIRRRDLLDSAATPEQRLAELKEGAKAKKDRLAAPDADGEGGGVL